MVNKDWLYRKILQNIGLNTLHQQLLMKKKPENFIILVKKEYSKFKAIYAGDETTAATRTTNSAQLETSKQETDQIKTTESILELTTQTTHHEQNQTTPLLMLDSSTADFSKTEVQFDFSEISGSGSGDFETINRVEMTTPPAEASKESQGMTKIDTSHLVASFSYYSSLFSL